MSRLSSASPDTLVACVDATMQLRSSDQRRISRLAGAERSEPRWPARCSAASRQWSFMRLPVIHPSVLRNLMGLIFLLPQTPKPKSLFVPSAALSLLVCCNLTAQGVVELWRSLASPTNRVSTLNSRQGFRHSSRISSASLIL